MLFPLFLVWVPRVSQGVCQGSAVLCTSAWEAATNNSSSSTPSEFLQPIYLRTTISFLCKSVILLTQYVIVVCLCFHLPFLFSLAPVLDLPVPLWYVLPIVLGLLLTLLIIVFIRLLRRHQRRRHPIPIDLSATPFAGDLSQ